MAGQRRRQSAGDRGRGLNRSLAFVLALSTVAGPACETQRPRFPTGIGTGVGTTGGGSGTGSTTSSINGTWRRTLVVQTQMDVVTSETTWVFTSGGGCQRTVVSQSLLEGFPRTQVSPCSYTLAGGRVSVQFTGTSGSVSFAVQVSGSTLILDGVQFMRIG